MADMLNTSVTGLLAYQTALATTSHNISNVGTEGYSRQRVELVSRVPQAYGSTYIGQGTLVSDINRIIDEFVTGNIREFQSSVSRLEMFETFASRVENLIADEQGSLMPAMQDFFNAMNDVANDPSSNAPRVALLGAAENLQQRFTSLAGEMQQIDQEVDDRIVFEVNEINALTAEIARLNDSISRISAADNQPADLLDKRDELLRQLAEKVSVIVVKQNDGTLNVLVGSGQLLVSGSISMSLAAQADTTQPDRLAVALRSSSGNINITNALSGGSLGGLLDFRNNMLDSAQNRLGRTAIALSDAMNNQHVMGYDLNGNLGGAFFSAGAPQILDNANNTGTGTATVVISDTSALTVSDYRVNFNAGVFSIMRLSDNVVVASGAGPAFANVDGMDFTMGGAPAAGDSFYIRPTRLGAIAFATQINDPNAIAAASPIRTLISANNIGEADILAGTVIDETNVNLLNTVTITFDNPAGTFDVFDVTTATVLANNVAYTTGMNISFNGWQVQLAGIPQAGDVLTVQENIGAATDNRNMLLLGALRNQNILDGNTSTLEQSYAALTAEAGTLTWHAQTQRDVEQALLNQSVRERESISGVNLDEEAANLIRFQQAYQALSRVIQTSNTVFQSLLDAV